MSNIKESEVVHEPLGVVRGNIISGPIGNPEPAMVLGVRREHDDGTCTEYYEALIGDENLDQARVSSVFDNMEKAIAA